MVFCCRLAACTMQFLMHTPADQLLSCTQYMRTLILVDVDLSGSCTQGALCSVARAAVSVCPRNRGNQSPMLA